VDDSSDSEVFEVEKLLAVCYGNPYKAKKKANKDKKKKANKDKKLGLYFKVSLLKLSHNLVGFHNEINYKDCCDFKKKDCCNYKDCSSHAIILPFQKKKKKDCCNLCCQHIIAST